MNAAVSDKRSYCDHGRKFHLTVGGDNKYNIYHEQFLKGTQIIQSNCTYKDMSPQ